MDVGVGLCVVVSALVAPMQKDRSLRSFLTSEITLLVLGCFRWLFVKSAFSRLLRFRYKLCGESVGIWQRLELFFHSFYHLRLRIYRSASHTLLCRFIAHRSGNRDLLSIVPLFRPLRVSSGRPGKAVRGSERVRNFFVFRFRIDLHVRCCDREDHPGEETPSAAAERDVGAERRSVLDLGEICGTCFATHCIAWKKRWSVVQCGIRDAGDLYHPHYSALWLLDQRFLRAFLYSRYPGSIQSISAWIVPHCLLLFAHSEIGEWNYWSYQFVDLHSVRRGWVCTPDHCGISLCSVVYCVSDAKMTCFAIYTSLTSKASTWSRL